MARRGCGRRGGPMTLRQLLTHTAGFSYEIWNPEIVRCMERHGIPGITTCEPRR